jgi:hypothetical protein
MVWQRDRGLFCLGADTASWGWFIFSIHDTEDGPICVWVRLEVTPSSSNVNRCGGQQVTKTA